MQTNLVKFATLSILGFLTEINLNAQPQASIYADLGQSVVYDGMIVTNAGLLNYQIGKYKPEMGLQFEIRNAGNYFLSGYAFKLQRDFMIGNFPFELQSFCVATLTSSLLREINWGIISKIEHKHIKIWIGTNFRTFAYTRKTIRDFDIRSNTKIHEIWNLIYLFSFYLKPLSHQWNVSISLTDLDYFTIERETNPILSLQTIFRINSRLKVFVETRYKSNVPFNLNMNYYGFALRTGIIFNI